MDFPSKYVSFIQFLAEEKGDAIIERIDFMYLKLFRQETEYLMLE